MLVATPNHTAATDRGKVLTPVVTKLTEHGFEGWPQVENYLVVLRSDFFIVRVLGQLMGKIYHADLLERVILWKLQWNLVQLANGMNVADSGPHG